MKTVYLELTVKFKSKNTPVNKKPPDPISIIFKLNIIIICKQVEIINNKKTGYKAGFFVTLTIRLYELIHTIVWSLFSDSYIVHMTLTHTSTSYPHKLWF